jgi:cytochrome c-type biogenesis protein CcmF
MLNYDLITNPELGHFALALAVVLAGAQAVVSLWGAARRDASLMSAAPALAIGQAVALIIAFAVLMGANIVNDFSVRVVAENSSSLKPIFYRITGTWGNHEGSVLLWCLVLGLCGAAVAIFGANLPSAVRARVIGVQGLTSVGFTLFALITSNPFERVWPPLQQGQDMNPLLQDPGLAIHPPLLYLGYVGFSIPFAFAVAALIEGRVDAAWGRWVRPWTLAAWCALTCGITLGSWWAYYDLGWGGFWYWDPVENASLLPWLTGTALLHSAIVVEKREALKTWTVLLAIGTFSLSLLGTFLVRSGILNSVHSFAAAPGRGVFILVLLGILIGGSLLLFAIRAPALAPVGIFAPLSREGGLILNNILLCSVAAVVLTGTAYPPFADLLFGIKISVGPPFYEATVFPLAFPLFLAMSLGTALSWKRASLAPVFRQVWWAAIISVVIFLFAAMHMQALAALGMAAAAWLILGACADIATRAGLFRGPPRRALARLMGLRRAAIGAALAHAGLGVTIAGIAGMSLAAGAVVFLKPGQSTDVGGYKWTLASLTERNGGNYGAQVATVDISRDGRVVATLAPERRSFPIQGITTDEAKIATDGVRDLYAVFGEARDGGAVLRLHDNRFAPWIWFGGAFMALGGLLSLSDRRLRVGAPRPATAALAAAE